MPAFPDIIREGIFVGINYGFDGVVHHPKGLERPEVTAGVGKFRIFEEKLVAEDAAEHEFRLLRLELKH